ncbi:MAG: PaaI family thioesterase [Actinomycetota bacterium]|nr:PaaI family thioesterase [Actinomycetota bacterium]
MTGVMWSNDAVGEFMGFEFEAQDTVRLTIRPELLNLGGMLSGAVTYAMVDYCMGATLWPHTARDEGIATISISINYLETATEGGVVCRCGLDRRNRATAALRGEVRHEDGRLLCTAVGSYAIFARRR